MNSSALTKVEVRPGVWLSSGLALFLEGPRALVVADVHWGFAASQRAAGRLVPRWGDDDIAARLRALADAHQPRTIVIVGDIVHAEPGRDAAEETLAEFSAHARVVLVAGNHDRRSRLATVETHTEGDFFFHHGHAAPPAPARCTEVIGHFHPAAAWYDGAGTSLKMPALVEGRRRFILPAFSPWAGGVAWNAQLRPDERLWLISSRRIFPIAAPATSLATGTDLASLNSQHRRLSRHP
jgi:metallophosphoesterase superfamily enzyme